MRGFYSFGGKRNARVFKLSKRLLSAALFTERREELLTLFGGASWHNVRFADLNKAKDETDAINDFVQKVFFRPASRERGNPSFEEIADLEALLHSVI